MNRRRKRWLLRNAKIFAVCGAMLYLADGLNDISSDVRENRAIHAEIEPLVIQADELKETEFKGGIDCEKNGEVHCSELEVAGDWTHSHQKGC